MTEPTTLSPAAQAVLDAYADRAKRDLHGRWVEPAIAAALRAATAPEELEIPFALVNDWERIKGTCASFYAAAEWGYNQARSKVHAIATELEG